MSVEIGRGNVTPSTTRTPTDTANAATDQLRRSPTGTPAGASPYSIRFRWPTKDVNTVSRSTSTTPATQKRPVTTAARTRRNSEINRPNGGNPTSARTPMENAPSQQKTHRLRHRVVDHVQQRRERPQWTQRQSDADEAHVLHARVRE